MRFALVPKIPALLLAATLLSAPMAHAGHTGDDGLEKANKAITELAAGGVGEEAVVGEQRKVPNHGRKSRKPRMATRGVQQTWNECVGIDADEAVDMIRTARPDLKKVVKVPEGTMVTMDVRMDRVRVYYSTENIVTRPPRVG